jgi:dimethylamine/trimethylamine dehydrogenase
LGLAEWRRVTDWRITQINKLKSIEIYRESKLNIDDISDLEVDGILIATGAKWAEDALGRHSDIGFETTDDNMIFGAERILSGEEIHGNRVVIYDDDHYYMGSVIALHLSKRGYQVVLVTPAGRACSWGEYTDEQMSSNLALHKAGVEVITNKTIINVQNGNVQAKCIYSSKIDLIECDKVIPLTRRIPSVGLYHDLINEYQVKDDRSHLQIIKIGDADAPSHIAAAIYSGYKTAIEFDNKFSSSEYHGRRENRII